ncbi:LOW QUALITY PROTEIN: hypothetical protein HID58_056519 [Brassica napus]|uniref:Uncharacterized protein n=1 Tax=Brassica napus TaxID=3708 RepID=A0ABQ8ANG9_BRANA|nr:LOW QUALITY PROTEIN: hypothetical protein HID58_056519 [Brassica napus]
MHLGFCSDKKSRARPLRPGVVSATGGITFGGWSAFRALRCRSVLLSISPEAPSLMKVKLVSWDSPASVCLSPIVSSPCELRCSFRSETGPEQTYAGGVGALFNPARVNDCVVCSKSSSMASCGQLVRPLHLGYLRHGSRASYLLALIMTLLGFGLCSWFSRVTFGEAVLGSHSHLGVSIWSRALPRTTLVQGALVVAFPDIPYKFYCNWLVWEWRWFQSAFLQAAMASACSIWDEVQSVVWSYIQAMLGGNHKALVMTEKVISLWRSSGTSYSGGVKRISGIQGNEENLTFSRVTLMVENGDRY